MAEARTEDEEDNTMREPREQVVRRQPRQNGGGDRPDRRKPEHRHSQGPLSSIRAAIKRTSTRSNSLSEAPPRERDRDRDRRRPEITILSAEPLAATSPWFPGASGGFPPPPPPAAQIWGPTIPPSIQPPPSYEEVIREKTQEQVLLPPSSSSSSSSSPRSVSTTTIATQTEQGPAPNPKVTPVARRPEKPRRPSLPYGPRTSHVDDITSSAVLISPRPNAHTETSTQTHSNTHTETSTCTHSNTHTRSVTRSRSCDFLCDAFSLLTSTSDVQTDQWEPLSASVPVTIPSNPSPDASLSRPRPSPRSKPDLQPVRHKVKVQTLVKLRDDGLATLAAQKTSDVTNQEVGQGRYLQELLEAFSSDDWGFPDHHSDGTGNSQSDGEEELENQVNQDEDMGTLKARIQAFEQQQQGEGSCGDHGGSEETVPKRPEPRPRPRLQGQPKLAPPTVAPKPKTKTLPHPKASSKGFWEDAGLTEIVLEPGDDPKTTETISVSLPEPEPTEALTSSKEDTVPPTQPPKTSEKPSLIHPKPPPPKSTEPPVSGTPTPPQLQVQSAPNPVPAPRPPPPKITPSPGSSHGVKGEAAAAPANPRPPPRPPVARRASVAPPPQEKSTVAGHAAPVLPRRPSVEVSGVASNTSGAEIQADVQTETDSPNTHPVKAGSSRPSLPTKPPTLSSTRRGSAPSPIPPASVPALPKPPTPPTPTLAPAPKPPTPPTPTLAPAPKPPAPAPKPPAPAPAPAHRRSPQSQTRADAVTPTSSEPPPRPSGVKLLPLRPPPIKNIPGRPPPPTVNNSTSSSPANQLPPSKTSPAPSPSPAIQHPASNNDPSPSPVPANQTQGQKAPKRGPPLPPRPTPGHPLYVKQDVLVVLDDPSPAPSECLLEEGRGQTVITPLVNQSKCLLDLDVQPDPVLDLDSQSKSVSEGLCLSESQSILPLHAEHKDLPDPEPTSGPRCVGVFDYEGEEEDELTFSQGDVIALKEIIGEEWGRGQLYGRIGIFPLNFVKIVEPLPSTSLPSGDTEVDPPATEDVVESPVAPNCSQNQETQEDQWAVALFDFPGQTADDLTFHKGALIRVIQHIDTEWRRGRFEGREGTYPAAFTQTCAQPIPGQTSEGVGVAKALFDFTAESENELTLKVGDTVTEVESVDEQWIMGVVGGKRGIIPKNYISQI